MISEGRGLGIGYKNGDGVGATEGEEDFFPYGLAILDIYSYIRVGEEAGSAFSNSGA